MNQRSLFYKHIAQTSPAPMALEIERAVGVELWDKFGKIYLDLISGIAVSNVGHCHPKVVEAIKNQAETYMHLMVYGEYIQSPQVVLAHKLASLLPTSLQAVYFVNSGSEANEGAMKLAKRFTGRSKIVYCKNAYHGSTQGCLSVIGSDYFKQNFGPLLPEVYPIRFNELEDLSWIDEQTACVLMENIQGEAGVIKADLDYLRAVRQKCTDLGVVLIFDEVQSAFGRTGKFFSFEHFEVVPDVLTLAKGMGAGMPIGAFISNNEMMACLTHDPVLGHITTFGGHPVSCAASLAGIKVLEEEGLIPKVASKAEEFKEQINLQGKALELRQVGLMMALEFEDQQTNFKVIEKCIQNGVITDWFLFNDKSMRIAPPLIIHSDQITRACEVINKAIAAV